MSEQVICVTCEHQFLKHHLNSACPYCKIAELEADAATFDKTVAVFGELQDAYNALRDGLRELADQMENEGPTNRTWYIELLALLGDEDES